MWIGETLRRLLSLMSSGSRYRNDMFVVVEGEDSNRVKRSFVEVGKWAND
jgi:hypothetical protein